MLAQARRCASEAGVQVELRDGETRKVLVLQSAGLTVASVIPSETASSIRSLFGSMRTMFGLAVAYT